MRRRIPASFAGRRGGRAHAPPGGVGARRKSAPTHFVGCLSVVSRSGNPRSHSRTQGRGGRTERPGAPCTCPDRPPGTSRDVQRVMGFLRDLVGETVAEKNAGAGLVNNEGMQERMIELRGVEKSYPQGGGQVFVLRRIDVEIEEGEFVSIMGPSGAGKSTLLHILGMHDSAFTGEYHLLGEPVHKLGRKERHELQKRDDRLRVPELPPARRPHRRREPRDPALLPQPEEVRARRRSWPTRSTASRSWARRTSTRASSRAASSSSWPWRARSSRAPS